MNTFTIPANKQSYSDNLDPRLIHTADISPEPEASFTDEEWKTMEDMLENQEVKPRPGTKLSKHNNFIKRTHRFLLVGAALWAMGFAYAAFTTCDAQSEQKFGTVPEGKTKAEFQSELERKEDIAATAAGVSLLAAIAHGAAAAITEKKMNKKDRALENMFCL